MNNFVSLTPSANEFIDIRVRERARKTIIGISTGTVWTVVPLIFLLIIMMYPGFPVILVQQPNVEVPCPPLSAGRQFKQTFFFPKKPVMGIALIPGTYQRRNEGSVNIELTSSDFPEKHRSVTVKTCRLKDNTWFHVPVNPSFQLPFNTTGLIFIRAVEASPGSEITFWRSESDRLPGGGLRIDGVPIDGDLAFKLTGRMRGMEIPWRFADVYLRMLPLPRLILAVPFFLFTALIFLIRSTFMKLSSTPPS